VGYASFPTSARRTIDLVKSASTTRHQILIADADPVVRKAVRRSLEQQPDMAVAGEAGSATEAVELGSGEAELVAISASMPDKSGIAATREIIARSPATKVVVLARSDDDENGLQALRAGAVGFLPKSIDPAVLPRVLRRVLQGEPAISRKLASLALSRVRDDYWRAHLRFRPISSPLTTREWEVVDLLHDGNGPEEIAEALGLKVETARAYIRRIYRKLGASSREEAVRKAMRSSRKASDGESATDGDHSPAA
jgi:DNA-binding NarL/FixJ family response regulator